MLDKEKAIYVFNKINSYFRNEIYKITKTEINLFSLPVLNIIKERNKELENEYFKFLFKFTLNKNDIELCGYSELKYINGKSTDDIKDYDIAVRYKEEINDLVSKGKCKLVVKESPKITKVKKENNKLDLLDIINNVIMYEGLSFEYNEVIKLSISLSNKGYITNPLKLDEIKVIKDSRGDDLNDDEYKLLYYIKDYSLVKCPSTYSCNVLVSLDNKYTFNLNYLFNDTNKILLTYGEELEINGLDISIANINGGRKHDMLSLVNILDSSNVNYFNRLYNYFCINKLISDGIVTEDKREALGVIELTDKGERIYNLLAKNAPKYLSNKFNKEINDSINNVSKGNLNKDQVINEFIDNFNDDIKSLNNKYLRGKGIIGETSDICPKCGKNNILIMLGKRGKFKACRNFYKCGYTESI